MLTVIYMYFKYNYRYQFQNSEQDSYRRNKKKTTPKFKIINTTEVMTQ